MAAPNDTTCCATNAEDSSFYTESVENGVKFQFQSDHKTPGKTSTFFNPKMSICREFVLSCLMTYKKSLPNEVIPECLDAFGATGVSGLQWKKHLGNSVKVTINDLNPESVKNITTNCKKNAMDVLPTSESDSGGSTENNIEVTSLDANVILHQRQFDFVNLDPFGCPVHFFDATFRNVRNNGVVVITATDVASLYGKCPNVTARNYGAYSIKCVYMKELAVRVLLGAAVRSASKCNKGLEVLYTVAVEHFVQAAVRIRRGPKEADSCTPLVRKVLHCQMCEERVFYPETIAPIEHPYKLLACDCNSNTPGKTAVELGPVWVGSIYSTNFLKNMLKSGRSLDMSVRFLNLLETMILESECPNSQNADRTLEGIIAIQKAVPLPEEKEKKIRKNSVVETLLRHADLKQTVELNTSQSTESDFVSDCKSKSAPSETRLHDSEQLSGEKRKGDEINVPNKKQKVAFCPSQDTVPFYYCVHRQKLKEVDIPRSHQLIKLMQSEGFQASRTHFEPMALKTNATIKQIAEILHKHCPQKPSQK